MAGYINFMNASNESLLLFLNSDDIDYLAINDLKRDNLHLILFSYQHQSETM